MSPDTKVLKPLKDAFMCGESRHKVDSLSHQAHNSEVLVQLVTAREVYNSGICNLFETIVKLIGLVAGPY